MDSNELVASLKSERNVDAVTAGLRERARAASSPEEASHIELALGRVLDERQGDKPEALKSYEGAFRADPRRIEALQRARGVFLFLGKLQNFAKAVDFEIKASGDVGAVAALTVTLGDTQWDLGDAAAAEASYARALDLLPGDAEALDRLDDIRMAATDAAARAVEIETEAQRATGGDAAKLWLRAARVLRASDAARAEGALVQGLHAEPTNESVAVLLDLLHTAAGRAGAVNAHEDAILSKLSDDERPAIAELFGLRALYRRSDRARAQTLLERAAGEGGREAARESLKRLAGGANGASAAAPAAAAPAPAAPSAPARPAPDPAKIAAIDEQVTKFEAAKRWADVVKSLAQKAELLADDSERVATFERIAQVHTERTNNAAEAIKAYEAVLEIDPSHAAAREFLKSRYEQRRDWEKLLNLLRREASESPEHEQLDRWLSMAKLATEKVKKPELCIELWEKVLERDGSHPEALAQLAGFYDRAKEFDKLAGVLREQAAQTADTAQKIQLLVKLGTIAGDKLNNDELAVEAWRGVLMLDPNDRRAQEALKKRYLAMQAWDELEVFYADSGKWDELIRVLERESEQPTAGNDVKIKLFFKIAQLWADRKEKTDRAAKYYEKVLELDANNRDASLALIPIYGAANDSKKLAGAYEVKLAGDSGDDRVETLRVLGELYEGKLKEPQRAYERFAAAFEAAPEDERSVADLERSATGASKVADAAALVDRVASGSVSPEASIALTLRAGRLYAGPIANTDEAIQRFRGVLDRDADNRDALAALDELFRKTGRWSDLHGVLERRLERAEGPDERREVLYAIGALSEGELNKPESAVDTYVAVLTEYGDEAEALKRLDALYTRLEKWEELASILERELVVLADDENAALDAKFRLGRTLHAHLGRTKDAIEHFREILSLNPEHPQAREALEMLLREPESRGEAARILEPIYELRGDWEALIRALEILLADESDVDQRVALLRKIGDVCASQIGNADRAFEAYGRALLEDPARTEVRDALEAMADSTGAWPRYVALLRQVTERNVAPEVARGAWLKIASVEDSKLNNVDTAVESFNKVLAADAADAEARESLEALLRRTERWPALLESYRGRLDLTQDPQEREQVLSAIATVQDTKLGDAEASITTYREMLSADPASTRALGALDQLFERQARWNDLADNLQARLDLSSDPDEQTQLMLRLAKLREEKMSQVDAAVEIYRQVLSRDATNAAALEALERLVHQPEHAPAVAEILEAVYRESAAYDRLVAVHEIQVTLATDPARKVELLHRIAELQETALDDPGTAFKTFGRALAEDASNEDTVSGLERLARAHQAYGELARVYEERVAAVEDAAVKVSLHQRAAVVHEELLQSTEGAVGHYRAILAIDPRNVDAVSALERLYQLGEKYEDLAGSYLQKASLLENPEEAKAYLFRASEIYETVLERPGDAVGVYRKVLEVDPEDLNAVDALVRLYVAQGDWANLLDVQQRKIDLVGDPDEKKRLYFEVGSVYESELKDVAKAIDSYNKVLELDPSDLTALQRLDQLYLGQQNWQELLSVLERSADLASDPDEINSYRYRVAEIHEKQIGDVARAVDIYRGILDATPDHQPTLDALENILRGPKEPIGAAAVLEPVYTAAGAFDRLVGVLEVQLAHAQDPLDRVTLLHRIAEIQENALDNSAGAFDAFKRALPSDPLNEQTLGNIERLANDPQGWAAVGAAYDEELAKLGGEPQKAVELGLRTARIYEVQLENTDAAIARYRAVLVADPQNGEAARSLDRLYEAGEKWQELADITKVTIALPDTSPEEIVALRFKLAQVNEGPLGDIDAALTAYREVLDVEPEHSPTVAALEAMFGRGVKQSEVAAMLRPIYEGQGEWQKLGQLNEQALSLVTDPAERTAAMHALADLNEGQLADGVGALNWHMRALRESPLDERSLTDAERLAGTMDAWTDLASCYADIVEASADENVKRVVGKRLGRVYEEELRDVENAEASYNYVLSVAPLDTDALERLDVIYSGLGNSERLAQVLDRRAQAVEDPSQKIEFTLRHAQILEAELAQPEQAIARYRIIVDQLDGSHPDALEALDRLYTASDNGAELYKVLEKKAENASSDMDRADFFTRQAALAAGPLNRPEDAVRLLNEVLTLKGEDPDALDVLATLHQNANKWDELVETLERQLVATDDYERKAQVGLRIASVHEQARGDAERAVEAYRRVLDIDSGNDAAYVALEEIFRRTQNWDELSATLNQHIQVGAATLDGPRQRAIWAELAMLYQNVYQQNADAVTSWRNVLDVSTNDEEAIAKLLELHAANEEWRDVVDVLKIKVNAQSIDELKIPFLVEIASVWEDKIQEPDGAREAYEQIQAIDTLHERAFARLEVLHRDNGRWEPLVEMYIARHDALEESDLKEKVDLLRRAAKVYDQNLNDNEQAFAAAMLAYEEDVSDKETVTLLERLAAVGAKWNELLATSNDWWKAAADPRWTHIGLNMAKWYGVDLNKPEWALPIYQQVLARQPDNLLALHSMTALYRKLQQWPQLTQLLERCMAVARSEEDRRKVHVELGEVLELHLNQTDAAVEHYKTALNLNARDLGALTALERVYEGRANGPALVDVLYRKAEALAAQNNVEQANVVRLKLADVLEDKANDAERAVEVLRSAVAADASNLHALRGLERLYARLGRSADLLSALEAQLDHVSVEREKIKLLTRIAEMQEEEFVKLPEAAARFEQVVEIDPNNDHAYRGLERLYRRQSKWAELLSALDRHISATNDRKERVPLFTAVGQVYAEELNDQDRAIDGFQNALDIDYTYLPALEGLARVYEKRTEWDRAIETLRTLSDHERDPVKQVDIRYRIGKLAEEQLQDENQALDLYRSALDVNDAHAPSLGAIRQIFQRRGDQYDAAQYLEREINATEAPRAKAKLYYELGRIWNDHLDERDKAVACFESAIKNDAELDDAAYPLVFHYAQTGQWEAAEPLAEVLVRKSGRRPPEEQLQLQLVMGRVAMKLGKLDRAIKALSTAHGLDRSNVEVLSELALSYFEKKDWENAFKYYHLLVVHHKDDMAPEGRAELYFRIGVVKREQGDRRRAINFLDKALEEVPNHRPTLEALVETYAQDNQWEQVIGYKRAVLDNHVTDIEERYTMLVDIAELWQGKAKNPQKSIQSFNEALELKGDQNNILLMKLLALYQETKQWSRVIETVTKMSEVEKDPAKKSRYAYTVASIYNTEIKNPDEAVNWYNAALDLNPSDLKAFEKINQILTAKKEFKQLERSYRKMLHRITGKGNRDLEFSLWHALGLIYRDRLDKKSEAITAFESASKLKPEDDQEQKILAELYTVTGESDKAIDSYMGMLRREINNATAMKAVYDLHYAARQYDKAWCVANTMCFLQRDNAPQDARAFYEQYKPRRPLAPQSRLDEERWIKDLFHQDEDPFVGKMFACILPALRRVKVRPVAQFGFTAADQQNPQTSSVALVRALGLSAAALNLPQMPAIFLRPQQPGGLAYVPSDPWASVSGGSLLQGMQPVDLQFIAAKHMSYYRPEHYVRTLFPTVAELTMLLLAAIKLVKADFDVPAEVMSTVQTLAQQMAQDPVNLEGLRKVVKIFLDQGGQVNIKKWFQAVELTACRAGFLLCGDLDVTKKMMAMEPGLPGDVSPTDKLKDTILFSISEPYFRLRESLGITFQAAAAY
ncbi:MAG: tetratricopeptide repeat protein [Myxococcales bacterium]|nr:tetratricopeptide repeat protein [Myxococcales bacterium]